MLWVKSALQLQKRECFDPEERLECLMMRLPGDNRMEGGDCFNLHKAQVSQ